MSNSATDTTNLKGDFRRLVKAAERLDDVIFLRPGKQQFNFLSLADADNVRQEHSDDLFWEAAAAECLRRLVFIDEFSKGGDH